MNKKLRIMTAALGITFFSMGTVLAQGDAAPVSAVDAGSAIDEPEEGSNADLLAKLKEIKEAYDELRAAQKGDESLGVPLAGLLLSLTFLLMAVLKRVPKLTKRGKKWIPWAVLGLAILAGFLDYFAAGSSAAQSLITGAGPALAVLVAELMRVFSTD